MCLRHYVKENKRDLLHTFFFWQKNELSQAGVGMYTLCFITFKELFQILPLFSIAI